MAITTAPRVAASYSTVDRAHVRESLRAAAAAAMAPYPQYVDHWHAYNLARVTRDIRTKMGLAFYAGEIVLALQVAPAFACDPFRYVTAWSNINTVDTSVPAGAVEWL